METISLVIAFNLGLLSTLHCLGMCGGIIGVLSLAVPGKSTDRRNTAMFVSAYNLGRIFSYTTAGAITGFMGRQAISIVMPDSGHNFLRMGAAVVLVFIGIHLAGWLPGFTRIEAIGMKLWSWIQPLGRRLLPVRSLSQALLAGVLWGWLPCALVYSVLVWSLTSGGAYNGAMLMFMFGLGTFPGMLTAGIAGNSLSGMLQTRTFRTVTGIIIILFGIASAFIPVGHQHIHYQLPHPIQ